MGKAGGVTLIVFGFLFILGGGIATSFFQGRFNYNGCGNILGQIGSGIGALFNNGNNVCTNLQNAIIITQIGTFIGVAMAIGGVIVLTVTLARRDKRRENLRL